MSPLPAGHDGTSTGGRPMPRTTEQPLYLAVTVDVDADANRPVRGRPDDAT